MKILLFICGLVFLASAAQAQTPVALAPVPRPTFTQNGVPLNSGCLFSFAAGTTTPLATYTDNSGSVANANPILLDSNGTANSGGNEVGIYLSAAAYKFQLKSAGGSNCSSGSTVWTADNVSATAFLNIPNTWTALQTFSAGISATTGAFTGTLTATGVINLTGAGSAAVQTALNSLVAGQVYIIPCGTYTGPASVPSNTGLISLGPVESTFFTGQFLVSNNVVNCVTFTYAGNLTLSSGTQNVRMEGITLDFGNSANGLVLSTANFNRFNSVSVVRCQATACVTLTNSGANTFNHLRVEPTGVTGNTGILLNGVPTVTTINHFYDTMIAGNVLYCVDVEKNADTNYFYNTSCNQLLVSPAATAAWLAFNLNTPGVDQDSQGNYFVGFNYTGATPISNVRSGQSSGNIIDWSLGGPITVTVTGGTPQFSGRVIGLGGSAFPSYNYSNIGGVTYDLGMKRVYTGQNATALTTGAFSFGGNWGTSPSFTSVSGSDGAFILVLASGSGSPGANPTINLTFADGTWTHQPVCSVTRADASAPSGAYWTPTVPGSATVLTLNFIGTPAASTTYGASVICNGKPN